MSKNRIPPLDSHYNKDSAKKWFTEMQRLDLLFHPEELAENIPGLFSEEECKDVNEIIAEINKHEADICAIAYKVACTEYRWSIEETDCVSHDRSEDEDI